MVRENCILSHCTKFQSKRLIRHKFLKGEVSKSNRRWSTKGQKNGSRKQSAIWNRFVPNRTKISFWLLYSKTIVPRTILSSRWVICFVGSVSQNEKLKNIEKHEIVYWIYSDNTRHNTKPTTLYAAYSRHQKLLPSAPHCGVWSSVRIDNRRKPIFLHQRDLVFWDSRDIPNFPPLYPIKCQESCIFLFL